MALWLAQVGRVIHLVYPKSAPPLAHCLCQGNVSSNHALRQQAWRLPTVRHAQIRHSSVFNEFKKKVQEELDRCVHPGRFGHPCQPTPMHCRAAAL